LKKPLKCYIGGNPTEDPNRNMLKGNRIRAFATEEIHEVLEKISLM